MLILFVVCGFLSISLILMAIYNAIRLVWWLMVESQEVGVDCDETFSPVVKPATIQIVLSLALSQYWQIYQLNVKNAFLHGNLK